MYTIHHIYLHTDNRCANCLAIYTDELLKSGMKATSDSEIECNLDKIIVIFKYIHNKDIFESIYRTYFAKRLLNYSSNSSSMHTNSSSANKGQNYDNDFERIMITKLKNECGQSYTSKLEGMYLDMTLAKETMEQFKNSNFYPIRPSNITSNSSSSTNQQPLTSSITPFNTPSTATAGSAPTATGNSTAIGHAAATSTAANVYHCNYELEVQTLTSSHWSMKPLPPCTLPPEVAVGCDAFQAFYTDRFKTGRRLTWLTQCGSADIKVGVYLCIYTYMYGYICVYVCVYHACESTVCTRLYVYSD